MSGSEASASSADSEIRRVIVLVGIATGRRKFQSDKCPAMLLQLLQLLQQSSESATSVRSRQSHTRRQDMAVYLTRFRYTPETWARLIQHPEDRRDAARAYIESAGGKLLGFWYSFGEHDGWTMWEAPDNVSMAAVALAIGAGGALATIDTTVLLTVEELTDALGKAKSIQYRAPGK